MYLSIVMAASELHYFHGRQTNEACNMLTETIVVVKRGALLPMIFEREIDKECIISICRAEVLTG